MHFDPTDAQLAALAKVRRFTESSLDPIACEIDTTQITPSSAISALADDGWLGAALPREWGGSALDPTTYGLVTEEVGRACSSIRSLMTVHNMATQALVRFCSEEQKSRWLPPLCSGSKIIAFALTEPGARGASGTITTRLEKYGPTFRLNGKKTWITYGQVADFYLVFALEGERPVALVVDRASPGVTMEPITETLGTRGSMLAHLRFDDVAVSASDKVGALGAGLSFVANAAIDHGRFSVAWGASGISRACLLASARYAEDDGRDSPPLRDHQLIQRRLANILVAETTARAVCLRAATFRERGDARAAAETALAKYHAADAAIRAASDALAIHGGNGCSAAFPTARYLRDATVLNIIEGTPEMHQMALSSYALRKIHAEYRPDGPQ